jgi:ATP-binding cassette subfamily C (CFTR/MRP) protein 4
MQLRVACLAAIFDKALRLKSTTTESSGRVMNLATNDVERFLLASLFAPYMIWGVIMLVMILAVGWFVIGWSFAVGIAFMMFFIVPFQLKLSRKFGGLRSTVAQVTDSRVNAINQGAIAVLPLC